MDGGIVRFSILGPLVVHTDGGRPADLRATKPRTLLAVLLLHANRPVSVDELTEALWPIKPPRTAAGALRTHAWTVRAALGLRGLVARPPGYQLDVAPDELDALLFDQLARQGEQAAGRGDLPAAVDAWGRALTLWRGGVLDGMELGPTAHATATELTERRYALLEDWARAAMAIGRHPQALAPLAAATTEQPLRERLHELHMEALYRSGRQADALAVYQALRDRLVTELGIEPGRPLQRLHDDVLSGAAMSAPRQLPPDVVEFVGRRAELDAARAGLPIVAIAGPGGVGKSAFVVRLAHRLAAGFPDGQLYVDLQGASAGLRPLDPLEVLGRFLRALGVRDSDLATVGEASAAFRAATASRRLLVVLDNASDSAQVRPLQPAGAHTATLITSRRVLSTLDGAERLILGVLPPADALLLLGRLAGPRRVADDPAAARRVAGWCGHLPLALRIAGGRLAARPAWTMRTLATRLADARRRLDELHLAELDVRSSIEVGHAQLAGSTDPDDRAAARALGLLARPDGAEIGLPAAAALLDLDAVDADRVLERLVDSQLLESPAPGRYRLHDLVRLYARTLPSTVYDGLPRLLHWYTATCWQAFRLLRPADERVATAGAWAVGGASFGDVTEALEWLEVERSNLVAAVHQVAAEPELPAAAATQLARALFAFFHVRGYLNDWVEVNRAAREVARRVGDRTGQAHACRDLGAAYELRGEYQEGLKCLHDGLDGYAAAGDLAGQAACLNSIGLVHDSLGQLDDAAACLERSLAISRELADRHSQAISLNNLGEVYGRLGAHRRAQDCLEEALAIFHDTGNRAGQAAVQANLGEVLERQDVFRGAQVHYGQSLAVYREMDAPVGQALILTALGRVHRRQGRHPEALACLREGLAIAERVDERRSAAICLRELGAVHQETGEAPAARDHWSRALALFEELGVPEADEVRALLA
jgi:DNA-binding SARP family transcriptional activator/tetratricopeptide (TPR) repeat protein